MTVTIDSNDSPRIIVRHYDVDGNELNKFVARAQ